MANQSSHFENIILPAVVLAGLYKDSLVVIGQPANPTKKASVKPSVVAATFDIPVYENEVPALAEPTVTYVSEGSILSLGDFLKNVLVLVKDNTNLHLAEPEMELLGKMLQVVKLSFADVAIVNIASQQIQWESLNKKLPAKSVILFGVEPTEIQIPVRFPHFRVQKWSGARFLYSPSLAAINQPSAEQVQHKRELWKALLEMFAT